MKLKLRNDYAYILRLTLESVPTSELTPMNALRNCVSLSEKLEKAIEPFMKQYGPYKDKREDLGKQYKQEQPLVTWETYLKKHLGKEVKKMDKIAEKHVSFEITVEEANFVKDFWYKTLLERLPTFTPKQAVLAYAEAFHIG